jgi:hypothetical protein
MMSSRDKKNVIVVVHDAGGAEVIGAYVRKNPKHEHFICYGAGPSKKVFARLHLPIRPVGGGSVRELARILQRHADVKYALIASPGWMSKTEINAIQAAKRVGLKTIVYMDSWLDGRKRFGYPKKNWERRLPDAFWSGDRYGLAQLKKYFLDIPVRLEPNQYFADKIRLFRAIKRTVNKPEAILFTSTTGGDSHRLLEALLRQRAEAKRPTRLRIRFHPADARDRYDVLIQKFARRVHVEKSHEKDLVNDLVHARVVIGAETMALAIAALCRIRTISFVSHGAHPILPMKEIMQTRNIRTAASLVVNGN